MCLWGCCGQAGENRGCNEDGLRWSAVIELKYSLSCFWKSLFNCLIAEGKANGDKEEDKKLIYCL